MQQKLSLVLLVAVTACGRTSGLPEPVSQPQPEISATTPPTVARTWTFTHDSQPSAYTTTSTTTLELRLDTATQRDTLTLTAVYTISLSRSEDSDTFSGSVDQLQLKTGTRIGRHTDSTALPLRFSGHIGNGMLVLDSINGMARGLSLICSGNVLSILPIIQRSILTLPAMVTTGMAWKDSAVSTDCSGSVPVTLRATREYRAIGETAFRGRRLVLVERSDRTMTSGEGAQGQNRVMLRAEGSGLTRFYLDPVTGRLEASETEQRSQIGVTASGRTRSFQQLVREETVRVAPAN